MEEVQFKVKYDGAKWLVAGNLYLENEEKTIFRSVAASKGQVTLEQAD